MLLWLAVEAFGRDLVSRGSRIQPPEAWFVLEGPVRCEVTAIVGPDGLAQDARPENCPAVLGAALHEEVMRWRWAPDDFVSIEEVEIEVAPPSFAPRGKDCLVGVEVREGRPALLAEPTRRCALELGGLAPVDTKDRRTTAWCAADLVADAQGVQSLEIADCAEGYAEATAAALRTWTFSARKPQRWRVLVGYLPPG